MFNGRPTGLQSIPPLRSKDRDQELKKQTLQITFARKDKCLKPKSAKGQTGALSLARALRASVMWSNYFGLSPLQVQPPAAQGGTILRRSPLAEIAIICRNLLLWMDDIHFAPLGNHGKPWKPFGIYRGNIIPGSLRWCEMDFVHPQ